MAICPECKAENQDNARFCKECGIKLEQAPEETPTEEETTSTVSPESSVVTCPECNTENPSNAKFCKKCGFGLSDAPLTEDSSETIPVAPEQGERLTVASGPERVYVEKENFWTILRYPMGTGTGLLMRAFIFDISLGLWIILTMSVAEPGASWIPLIFGVVLGFLALGYLVTVIETTIRGEHEPPEWRQIGTIAKNGVVAALSYIAVCIVPILVAFIGDTLKISGVMNIISLVLLFLGSIYWVIAMCRYADTKALRSLLDFPGIMANFGRNWPGYFAVLILSIVALAISIPVGYFVIPFVTIYYMIKYRKGAPDPSTVGSFVGRISIMIARIMSNVAVITAYASRTFWGILIGCFVMMFVLSAGLVIAEMLIFIIYGYWLTTFTTRMLAHAYRGDKISFKRI